MENTKKNLELVRNFNNLVKNNIKGPNCIDPEICHGDCCFIHIPIPKFLAIYYISKKWAIKEDFQRGSNFSFEIKVDLESLRCVFYDRKINGCSLHKTGYKPPHCWVYPTGLIVSSIEHQCKKYPGWFIVDANQIDQANDLLKEYVKICKNEAKLENSYENLLNRINMHLSHEISTLPPHAISGIEDGWEYFSVLKGEGYNIGVKSFCDEISCEKNYFQCPQVCERLSNALLKFLKENLPLFIKENEFKKNYTIFELKKLEKKEKKERKKREIKQK